MKRILSAVCAAALVLALCSTAFAASCSDVTGVVTAIENNQVTVKLANGSELVFNTDSKTVWLDAQTGKALTLAGLSVGDSFRALHSSAVTASIPPQSYLYAMLVTKSGANSHFHDFTVGAVKTEQSGVTLTNAKGDLILTIPKGASVTQLEESGVSPMNPSAIKAGSKLIAFYDIVAESDPAQATSPTVMVLQVGTDSITPNPPQTGAADNGMLVAALLLGGAATLCALGVYLHSRKQKGQ